MAKGTAQEWSIRALGVELSMDRTVLARKLKGLDPAREAGKVRYFYMADVFNHLADGEKLDPQQESAKLNKSRREKIDLEKAEMEKELVRLDEMTDVFEECVVNMKTKLLALPSKATAQMRSATNNGQAENILNELIREALTELALQTVSKNSKADSASTDAPAKTNSKPVGRRKTKT